MRANISNIYFYIGNNQVKLKLNLAKLIITKLELEKELNQISREYLIQTQLGLAHLHPKI